MSNGAPTAYYVSQPIRFVGNESGPPDDYADVIIVPEVGIVADVDEEVFVHFLAGNIEGAVVDCGGYNPETEKLDEYGIILAECRDGGTPLIRDPVRWHERFIAFGSPIILSDIPDWNDE